MKQMTKSYLTCIATIFLSTTAIATYVQAAETESDYKPARTEFGRPDLQGTWSTASITTLERSSRYDKLVLSAEEVQDVTAAHPQNVRLRTDDNLVQGQLLDGSDLSSGRGYNAFWIDPGTKFGYVRGEYRTSWIIEPTDGKIPYNDYGKEFSQSVRALYQGFDGPESRPLGERCIIIGGRVGPPMINGLYNNNYQISQTEDYVVIWVEMVSHARVIPIDHGSRDHNQASIAPLFGESIGRWDGDTLVVESTNFHPLQTRSTVKLSKNGKIVERFTRVSEEQILYQFTVEDPVFYTQPWHGEMSLNASQDRLYEFACQ